MTTTSLFSNVALADGDADANGSKGGEAAASDDKKLRLRIVRRDRTAFGTQVQILATAHTDAEARLVAAHLEAAFAELSRVATLLDDTKDDSDIARVNANAGVAPVAVSPEVFNLLLESQRLSQLTQGAFDATYAALKGVWRYRANDPVLTVAKSTDAGTPPASPEAPVDVAPDVPDDALIEQQRALVSHADLLLDPAARTAFLRRKGMRMSLAGIGKGHALDLAAQKLESLGVKDFIVSAGGDLVVRGMKDNQPWKVGIQDPRAQGYFAALSTTAGAVMTTGDYEKFFFKDKVRYHHVLDPRTGKPARGLRSATVLATGALDADALSTAVFVLGAKDGMALVERMDGVEAVLVTDANKVLVSTGLAGKVEHRPPTDAP